LDKLEDALKEFVCICTSGGLVFESSLLNLNHDVDAYLRSIDYTRASSLLGLSFDYNTYSLCTVGEWYSGLAAEFKFHKFLLL
jgi:hypothetical protein